MTSNLIGDKLQNDAKLNGFSALADKGSAPINGRYRSKSLSSDKLSKSNEDRAAILGDAEDQHVAEKSETPGCLVQNGLRNPGSHGAMNGFKDAKVSYGTDTPGKGRRVIFCVHGNPSTGCCAVIETDADGTQHTRDGSLTGVETRHCHRSRNEEIDKRARRKLIIASVLCVVFMIGEIVGGYLSNSLAIATDAAHLLTDFASFMISLFSLWVATRPPTRRMPFGWYRAEVIGALTSVLLIWVVTGILVYMAVQRVIYRDFDIDATVMLITASVGLLVNLIMGVTLHQHGHSHGGGGGHGHSHGAANPVLNNKKDSSDGDVESSTSQQTEHRENINVRAAFIHVLGDFLQSFGVLVAAIVIYFQPEWNLVDPICTFLFSVLVLLTTFNIIKDTLLVLMEGSPRGIDFQDVANTFLALPGVMRVHNLRMWALSLDKTALSAHLAIRTGASPQKVLEQATRMVHEKYSFFEMTLQIEEFSDGMEDCSQCNTLGTLKVTCSLEWIKGDAVWNNIKNSSSKTNVEDRLIVTIVEDHSVVTNGEDRLIVTNGENRSVVTNVEERSIVTNVEDSLIVTNVEDSSVVTDVEDHSVVTNGEDRFEVTNAENRTQQTDVEEDVAGPSEVVKRPS